MQCINRAFGGSAWLMEALINENTKVALCFCLYECLSPYRECAPALGLAPLCLLVCTGLCVCVFRTDWSLLARQQKMHCWSDYPAF